MIGKYVNRRYYEAMTKLGAKYPADFERIAELNFYKTSGTVSSASSTTLTATSGIFNNTMVGDTIYNSTEEDSTVIDAYTSSTVVTTNSSTGWSNGDTIYVLGHEFTLGGDASDVRYPIEVRVKYGSDDLGSANWVECERRVRPAVRKIGNEVFSVIRPYWYRTNIKDSNGVYQNAVGVLPEPTQVVTNGLQVTYLEMPAKMSSDSNVPELPLGSQHILIYGATVDALKKLRRDDEIPYWLNEWEKGKMEMVGDYARSYVQPRKGERTRREYDIRLRNV